MTRIVAPHVMYSVALFVLAMILLIVARPRHVFDHDGRPRPFGCGKDQTMVSLGVLTAVIAILITYTCAIVHLFAG